MKSRSSAIWLVACFTAAWTLVRPCCAADAAGRIDFVSQSRQIVIRVGDEPLATYVYSDPQITRPYFKDVHAPGGIQVTRNHPPRKGVDPTDHPKYHPGLWLAFGDLSGADSWRNKARVEHVEFVQTPHTIGSRGCFTVRNRYMDKDKVICEEVCKYTFLVRPGGFLILWDSNFQSDKGDFWFGDQEEMGLGVRMSTPIMVKSKQGGRILNDKGRKNEKGTWGKLSLWCDYSGWIDKSFAGIMIMPDPENFRPCWWHSRDYGFVAANPFGRDAFRAGPTSKVLVREKEPFHLSYGILVHAGASEDAVDLSGAYKDYLRVLEQIQQNEEEGGHK